MPTTNLNDLRILVPLEHPGEELPLVRMAATLAASRRGVLHLTHIRTPDTRPVAHAPQLLERAAHLAGELGIDAFPHLAENDSVTTGVQEAVARWDCNMMVMGWYRQLGKDAVLAAHNRALTKAVDVDTLIYRVGEFSPARRILVPTGGGAHSVVGLQIAHDLSRAWGADLEVLRVARDRQCRPEDPLLARYCDQLRQETLLRLQLLDIDARVTVVPSQDVISPIVSRASADDLVVLGASNDWRQDEYLAGSIPDEIASQIPNPVLMVRAHHGQELELGNVFWEQNIRLGLRPTDKWDAITQLVDTLVEERQVPAALRQTVLDAALGREHKSSTALGHMTAIPHAPIPDLPAIIGALAICPGGVDFGSPDGQLVHYIFLLLTPQQNYRNYIPVLAQIASLMRISRVRAAFLACQTPAEVKALLKQPEKPQPHA
ncbi:MAG: PTS sugar transporter subunit IIA [Candidatus Latescibacteria bacterium]|nr:PTS sugar transporter subunit IIA [Candidatus Latescibacterota bacterium]